MSQFYPQQPNPYYPPEQNPEEDYYDYDEFEYDDDDNDEESGSNLTRILAIVLGGGCLIFLCLVCCGLVGVGLWYLDPGSSLVATTIPGSDIGLSFTEPAYPDESVVNEKGMRLTILDVNRNAALPAVVPAEGSELIIVTIELVNLGEEEADFNERDFTLLNAYEEAYQPLPGVVDGALGRGSLPPDAGLEGRLVYEVVAGEVDLVLQWDGGPETQLRYIWLE